MTLDRRTFLLAAAAMGPALASDPLVLGLAPFLSPPALLAAFRPLREHLQASLGRTVETYTARDFRTMLDNTRRGDYDLALLPAHIGLLALQDWGFTPVARTLPTTTALVLVRRDSGLMRAADLRGARVGGLDPLSIIVASAIDWLRIEGLESGRDFTFLPQASANSGLFALDRGDIDALALASSQLLMLPADTPRSERVLRTVGDVRGPVFVARHGASADTVAAWRDAFTRFVPTPDRPITASNTTYKSLEARDLAPIAGYTAFARSLLASGR